jgi:hypothetical protein
MHNSTVKIASLAVVISCSSPLLFANENGVNPQAAAADTAKEPTFSDGSSLGPRWWTKNPLSLPKSSDSWLYHAELGINMNQTSGNIDLTAIKGKASLVLQKNNTTFTTRYSIETQDKEKKLTDVVITQDNRNFTQAIRHALTPRFSLAARYVVERNEDKYIADREMYYAGIRYALFNSDRQDLNVGLFYGPETTTKFYSEKISSIAKYWDFQQLPDYKSSALYFAADYDLNLTTNLTFSEFFEYMDFQEDRDFYFLRATSTLSYKLSKSVSLSLSHIYNYDANPFVAYTQWYMNNLKANGRPYGAMETTDQTTHLMINFSI